MTAGIIFRDNVKPEDAKAVREIVASTGFFYPYEIDVAVELVDERLAKGLKSGYHFVFAEQNGETIGYTCHGPIACTKASFDLYWIAVHENHRGKGLGKLLIKESEERIAKLAGTNIYAETSSRPQYDPTRRFYLACGYKEEARLRNFYDCDDDKVVFVKYLTDK